ncbi:MFS transporter [Kitasatospora sp. NPDC036755]|uniref:MFS transporter n=1 Tax=Kitasatospora sp. NPDC036755 TaxID=3154600 RepID=UPI0033DFE385
MTDAGRRGRRNTRAPVGFTAVTNLADGVTKVTLPLTAVRLGGSPGSVTLAGLAFSLPWLLASLPVGVLVDRADRRRLLWGANAVRLAVVGALGGCAAGGRLGLPVLYGAALLLGTAEVVALTAAAALVPAAVPEPGRERANAWVAGAETVCNELCGPFVGGMLVAAGAGFALGAAWLGYALAGVALVLLRGRFRAAGPDGGGPRPPVLREIGSGLGFLWRTPLLRALALTLTVLCACWGAWLALLPLYAQRELRLGPGQYGAVLGMLGLGGLVGAAAAVRLNRRLGVRAAMFADVLGTCAMLGTPALTASVPAVAAAAFAGGAGGTLWRVNARTIGQRLVPEGMLGRYNAAHRLFSWGAAPLGAGLVGLLADRFGMRAAFAVFALAAALVARPFLRALAPGVPAAAALGEAAPDGAASPSSMTAAKGL